MTATFLKGEFFGVAYEALYTRARPKILAQLIGQEHISNALARAVSSNKLSHAYLLVGRAVQAKLPLQDFWQRL